VGFYGSSLPVVTRRKCINYKNNQGTWKREKTNRGQEKKEGPDWKKRQTIKRYCPSTYPVVGSPKLGMTRHFGGGRGSYGGEVKFKGGRGLPMWGTSHGMKLPLLRLYTLPWQPCVGVGTMWLGRGRNERRSGGRWC